MTLRDFEVYPDSHAWQKAVREVQRIFPGTEAWLLSCSAAEGGWGRWVPNSQGSGANGWLQYKIGTFRGHNWNARVYAASHGWIVPASASSWYSPLGQALAGAWARYTGNDDSHWSASWGRGC